MKNVAIIGAGQLGSRHLQGLAKSSFDIIIEVVEPFKNSRDIAKQRFEEIPLNKNIKKINFYDNISELSELLNIVIIATNSDVRFNVVKELLENKKVEKLVLEKVLFQRIEDYIKVEELLKNTDTQCWVNHPRRMFPFYNSLKEQLSNIKNIHFNISGGAWGLGCNGLHFLDTMQYLTNSEDIVIDSRYLDKKLYDTKRVGFNEINGLLIGKIANSHYSINCFGNEFSPVQFNITSNEVNILIDEVNGWYRISKKINNWKSEEIDEKIVYFQSELTNILIEDILDDRCSLPTYKEAMNLHIKYLTIIINHINSFSTIKYDFCPIT